MMHKKLWVTFLVLVITSNCFASVSSTGGFGDGNPNNNPRKLNFIEMNAKPVNSFWAKIKKIPLIFSVVTKQIQERKKQNQSQDMQKEYAWIYNESCLKTGEKSGRVSITSTDGKVRYIGTFGDGKILDGELCIRTDAGINRKKISNGQITAERFVPNNQVQVQAQVHNQIVSIPNNDTPEIENLKQKIEVKFKKAVDFIAIEDCFNNNKKAVFIDADGNLYEVSLDDSELKNLTIFYCLPNNKDLHLTDQNFIQMVPVSNLVSIRSQINNRINKIEGYSSVDNGQLYNTQGMQNLLKVKEQFSISPAMQQIDNETKRIAGDQYKEYLKENQAQIINDLCNKYSSLIKMQQVICMQIQQQQADMQSIENSQDYQKCNEYQQKVLDFNAHKFDRQQELIKARADASMENYNKKEQLEKELEQKLLASQPKQCAELMHKHLKIKQKLSVLENQLEEVQKSLQFLLEELKNHVVLFEAKYATQISSNINNIYEAIMLDNYEKVLLELADLQEKIQDAVLGYDLNSFSSSDTDQDSDQDSENLFDSMISGGRSQ